VSLAALDLRRRPDHRAELGTQLLLGERLQVLPGPARSGWVRVRSLEDRYAGWVREWGLAVMSRAEAARWTRAATGRMRALFAEALAKPGSGGLVSPLLFGSRFRLGRRRGAWREIAMPDGRHGWLRSRLVRDVRERPPGFRSRIHGLLGVPYLWGGRTATGLDCSGFTQLVLREQGIELPRDARDQFRASRGLEPGEKPRAGDLVFFARPGQEPSHVGIYLRDGTFVHCRGDVHIGSILLGNSLSENELITQFVAFRRPAPGRSRGAGTVRRGGESA